MPFVLDNSVVTGWYIEAQATEYTDAVAAILESEKAVVPALWQLEFANVLRTACSRGRLRLESALQIADTISRLPIEIDPVAASPRELLSLAMRYGLSSYDAAYLEVAIRRNIPIACQDGKLRDAATAAGVRVL